MLGLQTDDEYSTYGFIRVLYAIQRIAGGFVLMLRCMNPGDWLADVHNYLFGVVIKRKIVANFYA